MGLFKDRFEKQAGLPTEEPTELHATAEAVTVLPAPEVPVEDAIRQYELYRQLGGQALPLYEDLAREHEISRGA